MIKRVWLVITVFLIAVSFIPLTMTNENKEPKAELQAHEGVLDLATWDYERDGRIRLDGEWEFYWNHLMTPDDFRNGDGAPLSDPVYMKVPAPWNGKEAGAFPAYGYATYRMVLKNVPFSGVYAIKKTNIRFSSAIYVNGVKLAEDGAPAGKKSDYRSGNVPQLEIFHLDKGDAEILIQVANYDYINAGIPLSLYFGKQDAMIDHQQWTLSREYISLAILGVLAVIYTVCFAVASIYGIRDYSLLLYAVICLLYGGYHGLSGERSLLLLLPDLPFEIIYRAKDVTAIFCLIAIAVFVYKFQKSILNYRFTWILSVAFGFFAIATVLLPIRIYTSVSYLHVILYQSMLLWTLVKSAIIFIKSQPEVRLKSLLFFMAILAINLYSIDLILFAVSMKEDFWLAQAYVIAFNLIMVFLVVLRFFEAYQTVDEMKNRLLQMDKLKDDFLSITSHELRTPLHAIVNITDTVLKGVEGPVNEKQAQNLSIVIKSGRRLTRIVNELLDFSRMKHGDLALDMSNIDLSMSVNGVVRMHSFLLKNKPIELVNEIPSKFPAVRADGERLIQIFHNLIGNAIKFTEQGEVVISARVAGEWMEICVKDTGIGIAKEHQQRIFQPFEQADITNAGRYEGSGLGLSITKKLVELHGGVITIDSRLGEGTSVSFTLPLSGYTLFERVEQKEPERLHHESPAVSPEYPVRIKGRIHEPILVVDDDDGNLQALINLLRLEGYAAVVVNSGRMALEELSRNKDFFLVILDIMMPDMSGFEVLREIRGRFSPFELPVLMLTANSRASDARVALEYGANDIVGKPFEAEELMARVRSLTRLKASVKNATEAEIAFLRAQINPHFLYNALNSIATLCVEEPYTAEELTLQLSLYLRGSFDFERFDAMTTLHREMELVKAYVHIEKARFGKRLQVVYDVQANLDTRIPPLMMQPLVENAIRHGLMTNPSGGEVRVTIQEKPDCSIFFAVEDDGCGMSETKLKKVLNPDAVRKGVGLWNISRRLKLHYDSDLRIESAEGTGTRISFEIKASS